MELKAYGEMLVCEAVKSQHGSLTVSEQNKAVIISCGDKVENIDVGDIIFYEVNKKQSVGEYFVIHMNSIMCKVVEDIMGANEINYANWTCAVEDDLIRPRGTQFRDSCGFRNITRTKRANTKTFLHQWQVKCKCGKRKSLKANNVKFFIGEDAEQKAIADQRHHNRDIYGDGK
jgi:hypothetical protein